MSLPVCPKCGSVTYTCRHPYAKVWCSSCGYVLREEGNQSYKIDLDTTELDEEMNDE